MFWFATTILTYTLLELTELSWRKNKKYVLYKSHFALHYCQALSISQSRNLSLSLRDRDRADTIITLPHHTIHPPTLHRKLFKHLEVTFSQVWYIIGIVSSSQTHFHSEKIGLVRVNYELPVSIRVNNYYSDLY